MRLVFLLFLITIKCFSQTGTIKINYDFNLNFGSYLEYKSTLYLDANSSIFIWNSPIKQGTEKYDKNSVVINLNELDSIGSYNFKVFSKDSIFSRVPYLKREILLVKEKSPEIKWKIFKETKLIGPYNCQKAIAVFRGRTYEAWFTHEIPIRSGPWKFGGLPGLIISVHDSTMEVQFMLTSISKTDFNIDPVLKADRIISLDEYIDLSNSSANNLYKKLKSKLPRGAKITITSKKGIEIF